VHGFTEAEISEQVANYRTALKTAAEQAAARPSQVLATQLALSVNAGITLTSPEQNYQLFEDNISAITPEALLAAFRLEWGQSAPSIHVSNNIPLDDPEAAILAAYNKSQQIAVAPPTDDVVKAFAYTDFGKPGQVAETGKLDEFDTQTIRFANNVRLNIKKTDTEKGSIHAAVRIGAGLMEFPSDVDGLQGISGFLVAGGLEEHNVNEILTLVAGHNVLPTLTIGDRSLNGIAKTTPEDLLFQLQLWTAYITSPGYRPEGEAQWKQQVGQFEQFIRTEPSGVLFKEYPRMVRNGDMRFGRGEGEELAKRTFAEFDEVYKQNLMTGAIEVTLVGDVDPEFAIEAVAKTFGALPERRAEHLIKQGRQTLTFPEDRSLRTMTHFGDASRAYSIVTWPTSDASDAELEASLAILSRVMQSKVIDELREELGAAYNPAVGSDMSQTFKGFGTFVARAEVETPNVDSVLTIIEDIGRSFAADGAISEDQLLRARKPFLEALEEQESTNAYWADQLGHAQLIPEDISRLKKLKVAYQSVSLVDLQKVAKTYLLESAPLKIRVIPENKAP
jgi:zinc protease